MDEWLTAHATLVTVVIAVSAGLAVALIAGLLTRSMSDVPLEDRAWKDPPPAGFRVTWWLIQWVSHVIEPLLPKARLLSLEKRLRKADLDYCLSPVQFIASRILCGAAASAIVWWLAGSIDSGQHGGTSFNPEIVLEATLVGAFFGWACPGLWLRDRLAIRRRELLKTLPFYLDIITLCVEAGLNVQGAITQAVAKGPKGVLRSELQRILRDIRAGKGRAAALRDMARRLGEAGITSFATAVIQAESMGMNLGPILRAQADQRRSERFLRAEKLAMEAPVKMLFPLIAFIFPCTFLVIFFPIAMKFMHSGL